MHRIWKELFIKIYGAEMVSRRTILEAIQAVVRNNLEFIRKYVTNDCWISRILDGEDLFRFFIADAPNNDRPEHLLASFNLSKECRIRPLLRGIEAMVRDIIYFKSNDLCPCCEGYDLDCLRDPGQNQMVLLCPVCGWSEDEKHRPLYAKDHPGVMLEPAPRTMLIEHGYLGTTPASSSESCVHFRAPDSLRPFSATPNITDRRSNEAGLISRSLARLGWHISALIPRSLQRGASSKRVSDRERK